MMINTQIGDNDVFGRRFNGHDLHIYLREYGIDSQHLVWSKHSTDSTTTEFGKRIRERKSVRKLTRELETVYGVQGFLGPFGYDIVRNKRVLQSDILHLNLVHNAGISLNVLPILTELKPTVWTFHDPWAITGHCVYPMDCTRWQTGCGNCPYLEMHFPLKVDTSSLIWLSKKIVYDAANFDVIVASNMMRGLAERSPLLSGKRIHVVNYGIDQQIYRPALHRGSPQTAHLYGKKGCFMHNCRREGPAERVQGIN